MKHPQGNPRIRAGMAAACCFLLASACLAAPRLMGADFERVRDHEELLTLRFAGGPAELNVLRFPDAGMGVVVFRGAELCAPEGRKDLGGQWLKSVSLRSVEGPDGAPAAQATLELARGARFEVGQAQDVVQVRVLPAEMAAAAQASASQADQAPELITNEDLKEFESADSQVQMVQDYGQDTGKSAGVLQGFGNAYVPEKIAKAAPASEASQEEDLLKQTIFERRVSLDFKDADLQNVIRSLAKRAGINLILTRNQVKGIVTLQLTNVRLGHAMDAILKTNSLAYIIEPGGIVRIVPLSQVKTETIEIKTEYIPINWVNAQNVQKTLSAFISDKGQLRADQDANGIIITDVPAKVEQISALIERMDQPEKQVMIEARLVDLTEQARRDLGIVWGLTRIVPGTGNVDSLAVGAPTAGSPKAIMKSQGNSMRLFGADYNLDAQLEFLETRRLGKVLANPRVITLNNLAAKIEIKQQIPYVSAQQTAQSSVATISFKETGVILDVTPNITNHGYVRMELKPEQKVKTGSAVASAILGNAAQIGTVNEVPIIDERKVESNVIVKDEETVILGGLRQLDNTNSEEGTPWLMHVPVIGHLFKSTNDEMRKTELVLFITPHIVKDPTLTAAELRQYEMIDYNWDLPGYFYDETYLRNLPKASEAK